MSELDSSFELIDAVSKSQASGYMPATWALEWVNIDGEERKRRAAVWDLGDSDLDDFVKWTTERFAAGEIGYPNALHTLKIARDMLQRFPISKDGWNLLGLGLRRDVAASFVADYAPIAENERLPDIAETITKELALHSSGHITGYDVLAWESSQFHSWYCSRSTKDISEELGIFLGSNGLLVSYIDAVKIADGAAQPHDVSPVSSVACYPWAVVNYPV